MKNNEKHMPLRKCIACSEMRKKSELLKIVISKDGEVTIDINGKLPGRGCYVCKTEKCVLIAEKQHKVAKAFKRNVSHEIYGLLKEHINE